MFVKVYYPPVYVSINSSSGGGGGMVGVRESVGALFLCSLEAKDMYYFVFAYEHEHEHEHELTPTSTA